MDPRLSQSHQQIRLLQQQLQQLQQNQQSQQQNILDESKTSDNYIMEQNEDEILKFLQGSNSCLLFLFLFLFYFYFYFYFIFYFIFFF